MGVLGEPHTKAMQSGWHALSVQCVWAAWVITAAPFIASAAPVDASAVHCAINRCGLHADGPYPNYVIGTLAHIGTDADLHQAFHWAKSHGYWKPLPASFAPYPQDVKLITIRLPRTMARHPVSVFVTRQEYVISPYRVGDLVRYSPHGADHETPPKPGADDAALFHGLTGCVALLCRRGDHVCASRYTQGVFTKADGEQVDLQTNRVIPGGVRIDPVSLLPVK